MATSSFSYCDVCRRSVTRLGHGHNFTPAHQSRVVHVLEKARCEVAQATAFLAPVRDLHGMGGAGALRGCCSAVRRCCRSV
jgi:hypothetical protein